MNEQPRFEIPKEMRSMAEASFQQARKTFEKLLIGAEAAADSMEQRGATVRAGAKEIGAKAIGFAEKNMQSSLDYAQSLLHAKDMKPGTTPTTDIGQGGDAFTEVGHGVIDWKRIFEAAPEAGVKHYFVEQDKCDDGEPMNCAKVSYEYLKNLQV